MNGKAGYWWMVLVVFAIGCSEATQEESLVSSTLETDVADGKGDAAGSWKVKAEAMTMWVEPVLQPVVVQGETHWAMRGRVSKTLTGFRAYTSAGYHFEGELLSERRFEVRLTEKEALKVVGGERVYLDFFAKRGATPMYHGMVNFAARFGNWAGSSAIYVYRAVNPVFVGEHLTFRGRASTRSGFALDLIYTDDDAGPALFDDEPNLYHFDWSPKALHLAADPPEDPVWFRGSDSASTPVEKTASIEFRLVQMGLGTKHPFEAWPPMRCEPEVRACLEALESSDTEECGWANQVRPCLEVVELPAAPGPQRFVEDLDGALRSWYATHEDDVRALNGRTLESALDHVSEAAVGVVDDEEIDLLGYDPEHFVMFYHPDPVFQGSDRVWYGTYDRAGRLIHIEAVN